jgi:hypothetical protein
LEVEKPSQPRQQCQLDGGAFMEWRGYSTDAGLSSQRRIQYIFKSSEHVDAPQINVDGRCLLKTPVYGLFVSGRSFAFNTISPKITKIFKLVKLHSN